ncbi:MAG: SUMF1/EgtB/PvdO family nonheme iron enzyme, partial [Planctomycetota bacterium]
ERDVKLLKRAIDEAPGPAPGNVNALSDLVASADRLLGELPSLRTMLTGLRATGVEGGGVEPQRLLAEHPAAAFLAQLRRDREAIAERLDELIRTPQTSHEATPDWCAGIEARLAAMDAQVADLARLVDGRRQRSFADDEVEYLHDAVEDQIAEIEWLATTRLPELRARVARAEAAQAPATGSLAQAWAECRRQAAAKYAGLELGPQPGLLPLGEDPDTGLLEFAHLASGTPPKRGDDDELQYAPDSGVVLVLIPGGEVWVGAQSRSPTGPRYEPEATPNEGPPKRVRLAPFLLAKHELGHAQWNRLATGLGIWHQCARFEGRPDFDRKPIARVTWQDCDRLCRAHGLALPTEAQWEHACRAGTEGPWWTGPASETLADAEHVAGAEPGRIAIDAKAANPFGLHHMHGNVHEWCAEAFVARDWQLTPGDGARLGRPDGDYRAMRGGSYLTLAPNARSAKRNAAYRLDQKDTVGLRPAMALHVPR